MALWYVSTSGSDSNTGMSQAQAYATIAKALTSAASGDTIGVQTGTYTLTASLAITQSTLTIEGYQTTPGDNGTAPLITTSTNSTVLITTTGNSGGYWLFRNLSLSNTASTRASGIQQVTNHGSAQTWVLVKCVFDGFSVAIDSSDAVPDDVGFIYVSGCEVKNSTVQGLNSAGSSTFQVKITGSYFHGNVQHINMGGSVGPLYIGRTIFAGSTNALGLSLDANVNIIDACSFYNNVNSSATVSCSSSNTFVSISNSIFYGNTAGGSSSAIAPGSARASGAGQAASACNAYGNNTGSGAPGWSSPGDVTLSANPFNNPSGGDFSLNASAGGGAACRGAGFQGAFPGGTTTGYTDIGAVQSSGASGSQTNSGFIY